MSGNNVRTRYPSAGTKQLSGCTLALYAGRRCNERAVRWNVGEKPSGTRAKSSSSRCATKMQLYRNVDRCSIRVEILRSLGVDGIVFDTRRISAARVISSFLTIIRRSSTPILECRCGRLILGSIRFPDFPALMKIYFWAYAEYLKNE